MGDVSHPGDDRHHGAFVGALRWTEVERRISRGAIGVLPIGAGAKQHGPHLPMDSDQVQVEWLARTLTRDFDILVWPTLSYGYYPAFTEYPGSCSLGESTFADVVTEILQQLRRHAVNRVIVLNTGVSTQPVLENVTAAQPDTYLVNVYQGPRTRTTSRAILQQIHGGHADERETSIMLALRPEAVTAENAISWDHPMMPGRLRRHDQGDPNYSPSGITGNPALANAAKGRMLLEAMLDDVSTYLRRISN